MIHSSIKIERLKSLVLCDGAFFNMCTPKIQPFYKAKGLNFWCTYDSKRIDDRNLAIYLTYQNTNIQKLDDCSFRKQFDSIVERERKCRTSGRKLCKLSMNGEREYQAFYTQMRKLRSCIRHGTWPRCANSQIPQWSQSLFKVVIQIKYEISRNIREITKEFTN